VVARLMCHEITLIIVILCSFPVQTPNQELESEQAFYMPLEVQIFLPEFKQTVYQK
jgi:hypothetical protein